MEDGSGVALFVVMFLLGGCDFLPGFYFLKMPKMFQFVLDTISQPGLFSRPIVKKVNGKWTLDIDQCVKMLGMCYFQMHWNILQVAYGRGAVELFQAVDWDSRTFIDRVRLIIFKANGPNAKKKRPDWTALRLQAMRAERVLRYWGSALDSKTEEIEYQGHGWAAGANKPEAKLTFGNCCVQLSPYALLNQEGKVKMLTCGCTGRVSKTPLCNNNSCGCHKRGSKCVPMHCGCNGKCYKNRADLKEKLEKQKAEAEAARAKADAEKARANAERVASVTAAAAAAGSTRRLTISTLTWTPRRSSPPACYKNRAVLKEEPEKQKAEAEAARAKADAEKARANAERVASVTAAAAAAGVGAPAGAGGGDEEETPGGHPGVCTGEGGEGQTSEGGLYPLEEGGTEMGAPAEGGGWRRGGNTRRSGPTTARRGGSAGAWVRKR
ncbi:unnamed protein product [Ectocarpus sp. CCAP 1310/34]|nr:unnamed protein product [Ectocarpus sp. CCAP 1310/34]